MRMILRMMLMLSIHMYIQIFFIYLFYFVKINTVNHPVEGHSVIIR